MCIINVLIKHIVFCFLEGRKDAKVQQDESYHSTGDLAALNTSCLTGFQPDTHRVPYSHEGTGPAPDLRVTTGVRSVSRPCTFIRHFLKNYTSWRIYRDHEIVIIFIILTSFLLCELETDSIHVLCYKENF